MSYSRCNKKAKTDGIVIEPEGQSIGAVLSAKQLHAAVHRDRLLGLSFRLLFGEVCCRVSHSSWLLQNFM